MATRDEDAQWKRIADEISGSEGGLWEPPDFVPDPQEPAPWFPLLNPIQTKIFNDPSPTLLASGEKGSGKTIGLSHGDVRHLYENGNALCLVIVNYITAGSEGIWHDFEQFILPAWRDGNRYPDWLNGEKHPRAGELIDEGIGLIFQDTKLDPLTKDRHIWIFSASGAWSKLLLKSIPTASQVEDRIKGPAPSRVHVEELTNCNGPEYYTFPAAQLDRRRGIYGPQQYVASCNPKGPSHWVFKEIVDQEFDEAGKKNPEITVHHVPITENLQNLPPNYQRRLENTFKDPYERRRLLFGEWVDRPEGDAIFKDWWRPEIFVRGDALKNLGIAPIRGHPIIVGVDPGPKNFSIHFEQRIPLRSATKPFIWPIFDELNYVGRWTTYRAVVWEWVRRMRYWNEKFGPFTWTYISDEAAFNQKNRDGKFDATEILQESIRQGWPIRMKAAPKGKESVPQRVQMVTNGLMEESIIVSAMCEKTQDMFNLLTSKNTKDGEYDEYQGLRPNRSPYIHPFDSLSYPMWYYQMLPGRMPSAQEIQPPRAYAIGGGS